MKKIRAIISGGGTGGHIFPAISIAESLKKANPENEILFVGAKGKMEMEKVPAAGYKIIGLPVVGLQRTFTWEHIKNNLMIPFKVISSYRQARKIIREFKPDIVIGVGGYASAPLLWAATSMHYPALIQEQNGFAGLTNRTLGKKASTICVAYDGMEKFFPAEKIVITGNPIRSDMVPSSAETREEAMKFYNLDPSKKHIFIVGGSLGSGTLNKAVKNWIDSSCKGGEEVEVLWQCGKYYKKGIDEYMAEHPECKGVQHFDFIQRMDLAYAAADVVVSRSGASTVSELCSIGKATIFVPSPNVAEDHQTHNAMALVKKGAARIIKDADAPNCLLEQAIALASDEKAVEELERNILSLARRNAADEICEEIYKLI